MTIVQAKASGHVIAETDDAVQVEGNYYFPSASIKSDIVLETSDLHTTCPWKGVASYYNITVDGRTLQNAAWYYPEPSTDKGQVVKDRVAFYPSKVEVDARDGA